MTVSSDGNQNDGAITSPPAVTAELNSSFGGGGGKKAVSGRANSIDSCYHSLEEKAVKRHECRFTPMQPTLLFACW